MVERRCARGIYRNLYKRDHGTGAIDDEQNDQTAYPTADGGSRPRKIEPYVPPTDVSENEALPYGNVVGALPRLLAATTMRG